MEPHCGSAPMILATPGEVKPTRANGRRTAMSGFLESRGEPVIPDAMVILIAAKDLVNRPRLTQWPRRFFAALRMTY
jgi:hypothetical protein